MNPAGIGGKPMPFCKSARAGGFVFTSGQVPLDEHGEVVPGGIVEHSHQVFNNLIAALEAAGASLEDVVKCTVWLDDARDFASFNKVFLHYFGDKAPARSCVESRLMVAGLVEMEAIAYLGDS
jgi:reactive intermediate/imine deaminase